MYFCALQTSPTGLPVYHLIKYLDITYYNLNPGENREMIYYGIPWYTMVNNGISVLSRLSAGWQQNTVPRSTPWYSYMYGTLEHG